MLSLDVLVGLYLDHARVYYRRVDGTPTRHAVNLELALRPLRVSAPADAYGLADFRRYRDGLITRGLLRPTINQWCGWVRGMFRWAASEGHVSSLVPAGLAAMEPLRYARSSARERVCQPLLTRESIIAVLAHAGSVVAAMVEVQWVAGMRPGELVRMRWQDVAEVDGLLVYQPDRHKLQHYGRSRIVALPPLCRDLMLGAAPGRSAISGAICGEGVCTRTGWVFRTRRGGPYTVCSYAQAVRRACRRAGVGAWSPGRLRRSSATYARRVGDAETAQRLLGHATVDMTERYFDLAACDSMQAMQDLLASGWSLR